MEWSKYLNSLNNGFHPDYPEDSKFLLPYVNEYLIKNGTMVGYLKFIKNTKTSENTKTSKNTKTSENTIYDKSASISQYFRF